MLHSKTAQQWRFTKLVLWNYCFITAAGSLH